MAGQIATRTFVQRAIEFAIKALRVELTQSLLDHLPRHAEFDLANVPVGTQEQVVSWLVPIAGDYTVFAAPVTGAAPAGLLTATLKAGTKTPTGCTLIVANRHNATIVAATFDVRAFPI